jgi:hypothetical protein
VEVAGSTTDSTAPLTTTTKTVMTATCARLRDQQRMRRRFRSMNLTPLQQRFGDGHIE